MFYALSLFPVSITPKNSTSTLPMADYTPPGSPTTGTLTQTDDSTFPPPPSEVQDHRRLSSTDSFPGMSPYPDVMNSHRSSEDERIRRGPGRVNHVPSLRLTDDDGQSSG